MKSADKLKNMKVRKKLSLLTTILVGAIVILGIIAGVSMALLNRQTQAVADNWLPSVRLAGEMNTKTSDYRIAQYGHLTADTTEDMDFYEQQIASLEEEISNTSAKYETYIYSDEDSKLLEEARALWASYKEESKTIIELSRSGKKKEAGALMIGDARTYYNNFADKFNELMQYNVDKSQESAANARSTFTFVIILIVILSAISAAAGILISRKVTTNITLPLESIKGAMDNIVQGDLTAELEYKSGDELGILVERVNYLSQGLKKIIKDECYLLEQMAQGNFDITSKVTELYIGDFKPIIVSLRSINSKLGNALSSIAHSAEQIDVASNQLAEGAQELAEGATEQASTVQELLATVEEVTDSASSSADQAAEASNNANEVKTYAEDSNRRMEQMVKAMDTINKTSKEISTIISAIESIAAQTNLLSLNASIEAARAGDAGRGFAVVADEIGKLALQCSEAANNTRMLIESAIVQIDNGDVIAKDTAGALVIVSEGIVKIAAIADQVKEVSMRQAESMEQISEGIELISKVVESNSGAAEESSATSEELAAHADNLNEQLSGFNFRRQL